MKTLFQGKMGSFLVIAVAFSFCLGCAASNQVEKAQNKSVQQMETLQELSAGKIPCPSYQIEIPEHNINRTDGSGYWIAYCFGKTYKCTRGSKAPQDVTCEKRYLRKVWNRREHYTFHGYNRNQEKIKQVRG